MIAMIQMIGSWPKSLDLIIIDILFSARSMILKRLRLPRRFAPRNDSIYFARNDSIYFARNDSIYFAHNDSIYFAHNDNLFLFARNDHIILYSIFYILEKYSVLPLSGEPGESLKRTAPSTGHASKHSPHCWQRSRTIAAFPFTNPMTPGGQALTQAPQPLHR